MPVRIKLSKAGERVENSDLLFDQGLISIGRDAACTLSLPDPLVSKAHANIERQGMAYMFIDLNSTNGTCLNGEKIIPDRQYPLTQGDKVKIAGFELEFLSVELSSPPLAAVPPSADNAAGSNGLFSRYLEEWSILKSQVARELEAFDLRNIAENHEQLRRQNEILAEENHNLRQKLATVANAPPQSVPAPAPTWVPSGPPAPERTMRLVKILLDLLSRLSSGQSSFLSEFVARTTFQPGAGGPGRFQSGDEAAQYFADPALNDEDFASRQSELENAAAQLILHVMALLEGYRKSVDEGVRRLIAQIDPEPLRKELSDPNRTNGPLQIAYKVFPALLDVKIYRQIERRLLDLKHEDRGVLEKRYFRPGFIRGYEGRFASASRNTTAND